MSRNTTKDFFKEKKEWSVFKDSLLEKYLTAYFAKIMQTGKGIFYLDCFAGKGKFDDGQAGSPLIAAKLLDEARMRPTARVPHLDRCVFIESKYAAELEENVSSSTNLSIKVIPGRFEDHIRLVLQLGIGQNLFVYIDPYGIKSLNMSLFAEISRSKKFNTTELLINFNSFGLFREGCRLIGVDVKEDGLEGLVEQDDSKIESMSDMDRIMGGDYWKKTIFRYRNHELDSHGAEREIARGFCERLNQAFRYVIDLPIRASDGNNPKYRMIHATNNESGCLLMADNMYKRSEELRLQRNGGQMWLLDMAADDSLFNETQTKMSLLECVSPDQKRSSKIMASYYTKNGVHCSSSKLFTFFEQLQDEGKIKIIRDPEYTSSGKVSAFKTEKGKNKIYIERTTDENRR